MLVFEVRKDNVNEDGSGGDERDIFEKTLGSGLATKGERVAGTT